MRSDSIDADAELRSFIKSAKEIFHGEEWERVHHYVERAWNASGLADGAEWAEVEPRVREAWD